MAADDDLIHLCPDEVTAGFGELAEEVVDVTLGALIRVLEVGGELNGGVSTEMRRWSDTNLGYSIDKKDECFTRGEDGAAEEHRKNTHQHACCWPFAQEKGGDARVFGELEEEEGKESFGRWENYSADRVIYSPRWRM